MPPLISVLLPVYNGLPQLGRGLGSILCQRDVDFECVVVDDGSTDGTWEHLAKVAAIDPRVRPLRREHAGIVPALQAGLERCTGRYIARMDADDVAHPRRLALQASYLEQHPEVTVLGSRIRCFPRRSLRRGMLRYERWLNELLTPEQHVRDLFVESPLVHPSVMLRADALRAVGGYREVSWAEDYDLWLRLQAAGARLAKLPQVLLAWAEHGGRLTHTSGRYAPEQFRRCKLSHLLRGPLLGSERVIIWGAGPTGKPLAREAAALGLEVVAFVDLDPRKVGQRIQGAPVVLPTEVPAKNSEARVLVAVGRDGAREEIRARCRALGLVEGQDVWFLA